MLQQYYSVYGIGKPYSDLIEDAASGTGTVYSIINVPVPVRLQKILTSGFSSLAVLDTSLSHV